MNFIINKISSIFRVESVELEENKLAILRMFLGSIVFLRSYQIFYISLFLEEFNSASFIYCFIAFLVVQFSFIIGFLTNICTVLLILLLPYFDAVYGTSTLGTAICLQFLFVFFFTNHGLNYSVDSLLSKKTNVIGKLIRKLYRFRGIVDIQGLKIAYAVGFLSYAVVSMGALSYHFMDAYWASGNTMKLFFTGAYLSKYYDYFRYFAIEYPSLYQVLSYVMVFGQSLFQILMIPLILFKYTRQGVIAWGMSFFIASLFLINLSYLPHIEILFWIALFYKPGKQKGELDLFYDDKCSLCYRSKKMIDRLNYNHSVNVVPLSSVKAKLVELNITEEEARVWMCGTRGDKVLKGFDLIFELIKLNKLLWILYPFFLIGKWTRLGYFIYGKVAKNRYKYFGVCSIPLDVQVKTNFELIDVKTLKTRWYTNSFTVVLMMYVLFKFPFINVKTHFLLMRFCGENTEYVEKVVSKTLYNLGFDMPVVFNENDLKLNEKWFVLYNIEGQKSIQIPIEDIHGGRLSLTGSDLFFFTNHGSDLLYFGTTLKFRRGLINENILEFCQPGAIGHKLIEKLSIIDFEINDRLSSTYYFEVYRNSSVQGYKSFSESIFVPELVYSDTLELKL